MERAGVCGDASGRLENSGAAGHGWDVPVRPASARPCDGMIGRDLLFKAAALGRLGRNRNMLSAVKGKVGESSVGMGMSARAD